MANAEDLRSEPWSLDIGSSALKPRIKDLPFNDRKKVRMKAAKWVKASLKTHLKKRERDTRGKDQLLGQILSPSS